MNLQNLFAVYDRQASYYLVPFSARSEAEALRSFSEAVLTSETPIANYPADFDLVHIGFFDLDTGLVSGSPSGMPRVVINGLQALQASQATRSRYENALKSRSDPASDQSESLSLSS